MRKLDFSVMLRGEDVAPLDCHPEPVEGRSVKIYE